MTECTVSRLSGANTASPSCAACALPMFTLPALPIRIHSFKPPLLVRNRRDEPFVSLAKKVPPASCPNLPLEAAPLNCTCAVVPLCTRSVFPLTCSDACGLLVPMPTFPLASKTADGTRLLVESYFASRLAVLVVVAVVCAELLAAFGFNGFDVAFN